jgi:hypothetical protein
MRRLLALAVAAALGLAGSGCATGAEAGDTAHARAAVRTLLDLCAAGRGTEVAEVLTTPARAAFIAGEDTLAGCERVVGLVPEGVDVPLADVFAAADVARVRVTGGIAEVEIAGPRGWTATVEAEDVGDDWRVTNTELPA